ncbi:MAG TPA: hypothetical protein VNO22_11225 [Planctomycetota bacterium]|nr:hypothetical protein [Planctomycetota bacterium]
MTSPSRAPGATASVLAGVLGLVLGPLTIFLGFALGVLAIVMALSAQAAVRREPDLAGRERAWAGLLLGILALGVTGVALARTLSAAGP